MQMAKRLRCAPPGSIVAEADRNSADDVEVLVFRQKTTKQSGYHTDAAACGTIFNTPSRNAADWSTLLNAASNRYNPFVSVGSTSRGSTGRTESRGIIKERFDEAKSAVRLILLAATGGVLFQTTTRVARDKSSSRSGHRSRRRWGRRWRS